MALPFPAQCPLALALVPVRVPVLVLVLVLVLVPMLALVSVRILWSSLLECLLPQRPWVPQGVACVFVFRGMLLAPCSGDLRRLFRFVSCALVGLIP